MRILITGGSGFIGKATILALHHHGHDLYPITYRGEDSIRCKPRLLEKIDVVIHLAARTSFGSEDTVTQWDAYHAANTVATLKLAQQAAAVNVGRFIFLSTIKVNGEATHPKQPFTVNDTPLYSSSSLIKGVRGKKSDFYALSKYEAEQGLIQIAKQSDMNVVIIRPPLVYGPGVKGNFLNMMNWLYKRMPLPFGSINNQRSFVSLPNLVDLITTCIAHPAAANQIILVSDGEDLSTPQLLYRLSRALDKPARLFPIPQWMLETSLKLLGKENIAQRLCGNLQIDISNTCDLLQWAPPIKVDQALNQTAQAYLQQHIYNYDTPF